MAYKSEIAFFAAWRPVRSSRSHRHNSISVSAEAIPLGLHVRGPETLADRFDGTTGSDTIAGTDGKDRINGRGGDDALYGYGGNDLLIGGSGADRIFGGEGIDTVSYMDQTSSVTLELIPGGVSYATVDGVIDTIRGVESIIGGRGDDFLGIVGDSGQITAGSGNDTIYLNATESQKESLFDDIRINGGAGYDILDLSHLNEANTFGYVVLRFSRIAGFEEVRGSAVRDVIYGTSEAMTYRGGGGDDNITSSSRAASTRLFGDAGDDYLFNDYVSGDYIGGTGDDRIYLSDINQFIGFATIDGGKGTDTFGLRSRGSTTITIADGGNGSFTTEKGSTGVLNGIEKIYGGGGEDQIFGSGSKNVISGSGGADHIEGGGGDDIINGNYPDDPDYVGFLDDGSDVLIGGSGADLLVFSGLSSPRYIDVIDRITDFSHSEGDRIDVSAVNTDLHRYNGPGLTFIGDTAFSGAIGELRFENRDGDTFVMIDADGDRASDMTLQLDGTLTLVMGDFVF